MHANEFPRLGNGGVVYVIGYADDLERVQTHKVGESVNSAEKRLTGSDTFCDPNRPLVVVSARRFIDRIWAEKRVHALLAIHRCRVEPGRTRPKEWFNCPYSVIAPAIAQVYREEQVHLRNLKREAAHVKDVVPAVLACPAQLPTGISQVLSGIFNHRVRGKDRLSETVYDAFAAPTKFNWLVPQLAALGMRFLPVDRLVVMRTKSPEFAKFMAKIGCPDAIKQLKNIVAFDHDGTPVSLKDIKVRCRVYDVPALLA